MVNELAPGARDAAWRDVFASTLGPHIEVTEVRVRHFAGVSAAARGAVAWGAELVIAVGGDGTVNACVNGIGNSDTRLVVVPAGTANDIARISGQTLRPGHDSLEHADWKRKEIDALMANGVRYYSAGGAGWAAEVAHTANRWRSGTPARRWLLARLGSLIYTLACVSVIFLRRRLSAQYKVQYTDASTGENKEFEVDAWGVLVANTDRIGKAFVLAPVSKVDDGVFELIVFQKRSRWRLMKAALLAQSGRLFELPEVYWIQVTAASISVDEQVRFFGDGESIEVGNHFDIGLADVPVRLMTPVAPERKPALQPTFARAA